MPLKVFKENYGGDINSVMLKDMEERLAASIAATKVPASELRTRGGTTAGATQVQRTFAIYPVLSVSQVSFDCQILNLANESVKRLSECKHYAEKDSCQRRRDACRWYCRCRPAWDHHAGTCYE